VENEVGRNILLKSGYVCIDTVGDFCVYVDITEGGLDIIYHPKPNPDLEAVYYVCGRNGNSRIFPIEDVETAIHHSRNLSSLYKGR
tara:strand:+ start:577 stop:834 length:258 start_codon:yes stop_codon:yes gene_type:complete